MSEIVNGAIESYARAHTTAQSALLQELAHETETKTAAPGMRTDHVESAFLRMLVQISQAKRILEIGCFTGFSALAMAEGLPDEGQIITCDVNEDTTAIAREFWARSPHGHKITLRLGPALETLQELSGPFDLVFIDADKENYAAYWEAVLPMVPENGIIVADNTLWKGRVLEPESELDRMIAAFNDMVCADSRVDAVLLPIRDGVTVARKR